MKSICVFCGSQTGNDSEFQDLAQHVGEHIAKNEYSLVYGGGSIGLMGLMADACLTAGGSVTGIIPKHLSQSETPHKKIQNLIVVEDMFQRKSEMERLSDGFLVLPGGMGTFDELFEMITLAQLKQHSKPVVLININGYFDLILQQIDHGERSGFIKTKHRQLFLVANSISDAFQYFQ